MTLRDTISLNRLRGVISNKSHMILKKFLTSTLVAASMLAMTAPAMAESNEAMHVSSTPKRTVDMVCMVAAVDVREAALQSAFSTFSTAQSAALAARASALHTAWGNTDAKVRRTALKTAWQTYRTAHRAAVSAHRTAHNSAWSAFRAAERACHSVMEEPTSRSENSLN